MAPFFLKNFSTAVSISIVVIPGLINNATFLCAATNSLPAASIWLISRSLFLVINFLRPFIWFLTYFSQCHHTVLSLHYIYVDDLNNDVTAYLIKRNFFN